MNVLHVSHMMHIRYIYYVYCILVLYRGLVLRNWFWITDKYCGNLPIIYIRRLIGNICGKVEVEKKVVKKREK